MSDNRIKIGDIVNIHFAQCFIGDATVLHMPVATGDCWILSYKGMSESKLIYVQNFEYMEKI